MADSEIIGGVSITVGVDTSEMDAAFAAALAKAVADGNSIAQALENAVKAPDVSGITGSVDQIEARFRELAQDMAAALGITLPAPDTSAVTGALNDVANSAKQAGDAASQADPAVRQLSTDLGSVKGSADPAADALKGVAGQLASIAGISLSASGIVAFGESIGEAFDSLTKADIVLTRLTGDAAQAAEMIGKLEQLGVQDGLEMPGLLQAAERMERLVPAGTDIVGILSQLADAAAVTGGSVETMATKFDTMVDSGKASDKALAGLGLDMDILKQSMVSVGVDLDAFGGNVKQAFASLDQHDRIVVLQTALSDLKGVAEDVADNTFAGKWHQALAQWDADLGIVQKDMQPLSDSFGSLKPIVNDIAAVLVVLATGIKATADQIAGIVSLAVTTMTGLGTALKDAVTGDFSGAASALKDTFDNVATVGKSMADSLKTDIGGGLKTVQDLLNQTTSAVTPTIDALDHLGTSAKQAAASAKELAGEWKTANEILNKSNDIFISIPQNIDDYFAALLDGGKTTKQMLSDITAEMQKAYDQTVKLKGEPLDAVLAMIDKLKDMRAQVTALGDQAMYQKIQDEIGKLVDKYGDLDAETNGVLARIIQQLGKIPGAVAANGDALISWLKEATKQSGELEAQEGKTQAKFDKAWDKYVNATQNEAIPITKSLSDRVTDLDKSFTDVDGFKFTELTAAIDGLKLTVGGITTKTGEVINALHDVVTAGTTQLPMLVQAWDTAGKSIDNLAKVNLPAADKAWGEVLASMQKLDAPMGLQLQVMGDIARAHINAAVQAGTSATQMVLALEGVRLKQEALKDSAVGIGTGIANAINDAIGAMKSLSDAFGAALVDGKNLGDALVSVFDNVAKKIVNDLLQGALSPLEAQLKNMIGGLLPQLGAGITGISGALGHLGQAAEQSAGDLIDNAKSMDDVEKGMEQIATEAEDASGSISDAAGAATKMGTSFGTAALNAGLMSAAIITAVEVIKNLPGAISSFFESQASPQQTAGAFAHAGLTPEQLQNLSNTIGVDLTGGGQVTAILQQIEGTLTNGQATQAQVAAAIATQTGILDSLKSTQATLTQEMIAAYAVGTAASIQFANAISGQLQKVDQDISTQEGILATLNASVQTSTGATVQAAATTVQMFSALQSVTDHIDGLKAQQASLENQILVAQSNGDTKLVTALEAQLGTVNSSITTEQGILDGIRTNVGNIAPDVLKGFDTLKAGFDLLNSGQWSQKLSDDIVALEQALQSGDIAAIDKATADLHAVIVAQTQSPAIVAALKDMQAALLTGNASDLQKAADELKTAEAGNTDALVRAQKEMSDAITSGDAAAIAKANTDLEAALAAKSTADTAAQIAELGKVQASAADIATAISKQQGVIDGLKTEQSQLLSDLAEAVKSGDGHLVDAINAQLQTVNGQLTAANSTLTELGGGITDSTAYLKDSVAYLDTIQASSADIAAAIQVQQGVITGLQADQKRLLSDLTQAINEDNAALVTEIRSQLSDVNTKLGTATDTLKTLQDSAGTTADNTANIVTGVKATKEEIVAALKNAQDEVTKLQQHLTDLNQALVIAEAENNDKLVGEIQTQIGATNTDLSAANGFLNQIQTNTSKTDDLIGQGITGAKASASDLALAISNVKGEITKEQGLIADLNQQLIKALASGNTDLAASIVAAIAKETSTLNSESALLKQLTGNTTPPVPVTGGTGGGSGSTGSGTVPAGSTPPGGVAPGTFSAPGGGGTGGSSGGTAAAPGTANAGGYTPLVQPPSPAAQKGEALPSDYAANLNAGQIAAVNRDNQRLWANYTAGYANYVAMMSVYGVWIPPDQRHFSLPVPTGYTLTAPDAQGVSWETESSQPLGPAFPDLPYMGPATEPGTSPISSGTGPGITKPLDPKKPGTTTTYVGTPVTSGSGDVVNPYVPAKGVTGAGGEGGGRDLSGDPTVTGGEAATGRAGGSTGGGVSGTGTQTGGGGRGSTAGGAPGTTGSTGTGGTGTAPPPSTTPDLSGVVSQLSALRGSIDSVKSAVDGVKGSTDALKGAIDPIKGAVDALKGSSDAVKASVDAIKDPVSAIKDAVDVAKASVDAVKDSVDKEGGDISAILGEAKQISGDTTALLGASKEMGGDIASIMGSAKDLAGTATTIQSDLAGMGTAIDHISGSLDGISTGIDTLNATDSTAKGDLESILGAINADLPKLADISGGLTSLLGVESANLPKLGAISDAIAAMNASILALPDAIDASVRGGASDVVAAIGSADGDIVGAIGGLGGAIGGALGAAMDAINAAIGALGAAGGSGGAPQASTPSAPVTVAGGAVSGRDTGVGGGAVSGRPMPHFAEGGEVPAIVHEGETVITPGLTTDLKKFLSMALPLMDSTAPPPDVVSETDKQVINFLKQITDSTGATADNTGTMASNPPGAGPSTFSKGDQEPLTIVLQPSANPAADSGLIMQPPAKMPPPANSVSPGADRYFDAGMPGPGPRAIGPPSVDPGWGGDSSSPGAGNYFAGMQTPSPSATNYKDGQYIGPPPTPHPFFSGYNPYGANQPFALGSYDMGGRIPVTGLYQLHQDEEVLTPDLSKALRQMVGTPSGGSAAGKGTVVSITGPISFHGVQDGRRAAQQFVSHLKTIIPAGAFGQ